MKNLTTAVLTVILFSTLFIASCKKTDDPAPTNTGGTGTANSYTGNWYINENSSLYNSPSSYNVVIESSNSSTIQFAFLYGFKTKVSATFNNNSFVIPMQTIEGVSVSGSGTLANPSQINMMYIVDAVISVDTVTAVLTK